MNVVDYKYLSTWLKLFLYWWSQNKLPSYISPLLLWSSSAQADLLHLIPMMLRVPEGLLLVPASFTILQCYLKN